MSFKIDTKEKFTVITPLSSAFSDVMTAELSGMLHSRLQDSTPHCILNFENVEIANPALSGLLLEMHERFYQENNSLVICGIRPELYTSFSEGDLTEILNITPTESEAWDIVQMEEMEREFLREDGENNI